MYKTAQRLLAILFTLLATLSVASRVQAENRPPAVRKIIVSGDVELHYVEAGRGTPVVFVHGSLGDGSYWNDQLGPFADNYRAIAYSRRYSPPNHNTPRPGYSAVVDAEDLAALINQLHLGKVHVVGHSYGALTALFLAVHRPDLVRSLVLAEAPAVSLLAHLPGDKATIGSATLRDIQQRMVEPMKTAFAKGDREAGLRAFLGYILADPQAWDKMSKAARQQTLDHAREWDVMLTTGTLFPTLDPQAVRKITVPVLLLSGENSYPFMKLIDEALARWLPNGDRVVLRGATHRMWYEQPAECRKVVLNFLRHAEAAIRRNEAR